jgi:transcriptional regulator with XRE-family HTH domain
VPPRQSRTMPRQWLGMELRRLREAAGLTIHQVATILDCSDATISRIETARVRPTPRDVRDMLNIYRVTGQRRDGLIQLARDARQKGWWHQAFGDLPLTKLVSLEDQAISIHTYQSTVVPALLQTEEYARVVLWSSPADPAIQTDRRLRFLIARQAILERENPPTLRAVLDEDVLHRPVGSRHVMQRQLVHLSDMAARHPGIDGRFEVLRFNNPVDPGVVHLEYMTGDLHVEDAQIVSRYVSIFDRLKAMALTPEESLNFIMERLNKT